MFLVDLADVGLAENIVATLNSFTFLILNFDVSCCMTTVNDIFSLYCNAYGQYQLTYFGWHAGR